MLLTSARSMPRPWLRILGQADLQPVADGFEHGPGRFQRGLDHGGQPDGLALQLQPSELQPRHVEQVEQVEQVVQQ